MFSFSEKILAMNNSQFFLGACNFKSFSICRTISRKKSL